MPIKIRSPLACEIARVDRDRFNEVVSRGEYPDVPKPGHGGRAREFDLQGVIGLWVFGRKIEGGMSLRLAANLASRVAQVARKIDGYENDVGISFVIPMEGEPHECLSMNVILDAKLTPKDLKEIKSRRDKIRQITRMDVTSPSVISLQGPEEPSEVYEQYTVQIGPIRRYVERKIEEFRNTLGETEAIG